MFCFCFAKDTLLNNVKITIKSWCSYSLQFLAFDTEASHDILRVWNGPPENEMLLKEISGSLVPEGIHSTLNIVTIQFDTDFYISKSGFAIQFSSKLMDLFIIMLKLVTPFLTSVRKELVQTIRFVLKLCFYLK